MGPLIQTCWRPPSTLPHIHTCVFLFFEVVLGGEGGGWVVVVVLKPPQMMSQRFLSGRALNMNTFANLEGGLVAGLSDGVAAPPPRGEKKNHS